ncbi:hypothetical protein CK203_003707 [Vitis vinifera]|uniref:Uncharacterized protein n=1 Tax=Vitis vinifera TaxID=29760 RepID=A0A438K8Q0_VITVI|nr:hypothetical protein CK203_003707 [Vitis vinifera]
MLLPLGPGISRKKYEECRAKATEDMLGSSPSMKIDLSEFGHKASQNSLVADRTGVGLRDKMHYSNSLTALKSINASSNLASGPATCLGLAVSDTTRDGFRNGALSLNPTISVSEQNQEKEGEVDAASNSHHPVLWRLLQTYIMECLENMVLDNDLYYMLNCGVELPAPGGVDTVLQNVDGDDCTKDSHGLDQQLNSVIDSNVQAARVNDGNCLTSKEGADRMAILLPMVFASGPDTEQNPRPHDDELNPMKESHDKAADAHGGSFSLHHEELADDPRKPNSKTQFSREGQRGWKATSEETDPIQQKGPGTGM